MSTLPTLAVGACAISTCSAQSLGAIARADSDVDLVIDVDPTSDFSLITLGSVTADVEEWLDRDVDIGERSMLRPALRTDFERDAVRVF